MRHAANSSQYWYSIFFVAFFVIVILPFIIVGMYNHFSADDFQQVNNLRDFGFWETQVMYYITTMGRYFAIWLMSVYFEYLGPLGPKVLPSLLILSLSGTLFAFLRTLLPKTMPLRQCVFATGIIMMLYLGYMRSIVEGLFWISGALQYQVAAMVTILFLLFLIRQTDAEISSRTRALYRGIALVFLVCAIGSNEIVMALLMIFTTALFFWNWYVNKKVNYFYLLVVWTATLASLTVILAPGNVGRLKYEANIYFIDRSNIFLIASKTAARAVFDGSYWLFGTPLLVATIILLPVCNAIAKYYRNSRSILLNPFFAFCILVGVLLLGNGVAVWSLGYSLPFRAKNMLHLFCLLLWFYTIIACIQSNKKIALFAEDIISKKSVYVGSIIIFFATTLISSNITLAWRDLLSGRTAQYDHELKERYASVLNSRDAIVEVPPLTVYPSSIFKIDLARDEKSLLNLIQAHYFGIQAIRIR